MAEDKRERDPGRGGGSRARNVIALVVMLVVICAPFAAFVAERAGVQLPLWLDGSTASYLSGATVGDALPEGGPGAWARAFTTGELQDGLEDVILDNTPLRAEALIANAELQRTGIRASNALFHWPSYPCFYGSDIYYVDRFAAARRVHTTEQLPGCEQFADALAAYAEAHPDITFAVCLPAESTEPAANPAILLTTDGLTNDAYMGVFEQRLGSVPNVRVVTQDFEDGAAYYDQYYRLDHHWTAAGAAAFYNELAEATGLQALEVQGVEEVGIGYMGSFARQGLISDWDAATDVANDFSYLTFTDKDGEHQGAVHEWYGALAPAQQLTDFYSSYFQGLGGTFTNDQAPIDETAIVVSDSYGDTFTRFVASSVSRATNVDWFTQESSGDQSLQGLIDAEDPSLVVFVATPWNYASMLGRYPNFFAQ